MKSTRTRGKQVNYKIDDENDEENSFKIDAEKEMLAKKRVRDMKVDDDDDEEDDDVVVSDFEEEEAEEDEDDEDLVEEDIEENKKKTKTAKKEKEVKPKKEKAIKQPKEPKAKKEPKPKKEKVPKEKKEKKPKEPKPKKELLDSTFNLEEKYFYQELSDKEWSDLHHNITNYFTNETNIADLLSNPKLKKGSHNVNKLKST